MMTGNKSTLLSYALRVKGFCMAYEVLQTQALFPQQSSRFMEGPRSRLSMLQKGKERWTSIGNDV